MYQEKISHFGHRPVNEEEPCSCLKQNAKAANYTYRIYSNKRRGACLIFRATSAALI